MTSAVHDHYVNVVNAVIAAGLNTDLIQAITTNANASLSEPGCIQFDVLLDVTDPNTMLLYEVYIDEAAFIAHQHTAHHQHYFSRAHDLLASRRKTAFNRAYGASPNHGQSAQETNMTISLVITATVAQENAAALMQALKDVANASLMHEPGCLQFDILTDQSDPGKVMLYEVYADETASQAHQSTPHFKTFLERGIPLFESHQLKPFRRAAP